MNVSDEDIVFDHSGSHFAAMAMDLFQVQFAQNAIFRQFATAIHRTPDTVKTLADLPFLPIRFFKSHAIQTGSFEAEAAFESSGTTGMTVSRHLVKSLDLYRQSFLKGFGLFYGKPEDWVILGLLPSYLERQGSSLVFMVNDLIVRSGKPESGFYLDDWANLHQTLLQLEAREQKTLLIGVSFALLDFVERFPLPLKHTLVMETGGMKGRRKELTREALHGILKQGFGLAEIHSEYGMSELLSQAYAKAGGRFECPPWMRVYLREQDDPLTIRNQGSGLINIIDLANRDSCAFIATDDIGKLFSDGSFEVQGRMDGSDVRGCNLLYV